MFTLALVLAMIWLIDVLKEKMEALPKALWYFVSFLIVTVLCFAAMNLGLDYEHHAVLIGYFYYIFHDRQALAIPFSYLSMFKEPWALLGLSDTLLIMESVENKISGLIIFLSSTFADFRNYKNVS